MTLGMEKLMLAVSTAEARANPSQHEHSPAQPAMMTVGKAWPDRLSFECLAPMVKKMKHPPSLTLFSL